MKITRKQLRRLILQEVRIKSEPASSMVPPEHLDKVHRLINAGELAQAQSFVDAFGGDPNYAYNYREYERVGDIEKLGAKKEKAASGYPWGALKSDEDRRTIMDAEAEIDRRAEEIAQQHLGDYRSLDDIDDQDEYTKMHQAINSQIFRQN
tara:strand:- start:121 stop:573 length:453 start_codon:yes stop_codon:yes gene_type:complete